MTFDEALKPYIDEDGLILERPNASDGPETGNGILNLCVAEIIRHLRRDSSAAHVARFTAVIDSCQVPGHLGLYHRGPRKTEEFEAHDDYRALACASYRLGARFAREIHHHGKRNLWCYDNLNPGHLSLRACHRRFIGLVPLYRMAAGVVSVWWPDEAEISAQLILGSRSARAGDRLLDWFTIMTVKGRACDDAVSLWRKGLLLRFPMGMMSVMSEYYGPKHPFALYYPCAL